jgi:hypothetical protein
MLLCAPPVQETAASRLVAFELHAVIRIWPVLEVVRVELSAVHARSESDGEVYGSPSSNHHQSMQVIIGKRATNSLRQYGDLVLAPKVGLQLPRQMTFERWLLIGKRLSNFCTLSAWCLGDWLIYGETAFTGRYREAIEQTSLEYQTLRNYAWVVRRFPLSRRRETLSFGHHAEVAALPEPEQDFWLRKAEHFCWSRNRLRREVRTSLRERTPDSSPGQLADSHNGNAHEYAASHERIELQMHVSSQQMETWQAAADKVGLSLEAWAVLVLDSATRGGAGDEES